MGIELSHQNFIYLTYWSLHERMWLFWRSQCVQNVAKNIIELNGGMSLSQLNGHEALSIIEEI